MSKAKDVEIMRKNLEHNPVGRQLTNEAKQRAAEFAVDSWEGQTTCGEALKTGIRHVTSGIFKGSA